MTGEEAKEFLINISYKLGDMSVEYLSDKDGEKMREAIKALEGKDTNDPAKWIPISEEMPDEKLPKNFQRVLITITNYYGDKVVRVAEYHKLGKRFQVKENTNEWRVGEKGLWAWKPLPEPYKQESEGAVCK